MPSPVATPQVRVEHLGEIAVVTLDNPATRNALSPALLAELRHAATALAGSEDVRCVVLTGSGTVFAAGADLREMQRRGVAENLAYNRAILEAFDAVAQLPMPTVAALNGHALGGGLELAMACTMRVAAEDARLGLPEVRLGILPGAGGTQRLPRLVAPGVAWRMLLTGKPLDATTALQAGLVDGVAPADGVLGYALELAGEIAAAAPLAVRAVLRAVRSGHDRPMPEGIDAAHLALEPLLASSDLREGIDALLGKRTPTFRGA